MSKITERTTELLELSGALKSGHFELSSGLHSDRYCQCAALFERPIMAAEMAAMAAHEIRPVLKPDVVLAPALGGILWGYELARELKARSLFAERKPGELFQLRRGFILFPGEKVLLAEDVVTTGKSVMELLPLVEEAGAQVVGYSAIADRSGGKFKPGVPFFSLISLNFKTWQPSDCPLCRQNIPVYKPGSRVSSDKKDT